jgi:hypothetical protein
MKKKQNLPVIILIKKQNIMNHALAGVKLVIIKEIISKIIAHLVKMVLDLDLMKRILQIV